MAEPAVRSARYAELEGLPDTVIGEIIDGELVVSPRPGGPHAVAASVLTMGVGSPFGLGSGGPGGWWIVAEPELHLGGHVLVPDLAGWRRERMPSYPREAAVTLDPDWVCEVLSKSTAGRDRIRKLPIYAAEGVNHAWLVDPEQRTLEVFRRVGDHWTVVAGFADDEQVRAEPFDAVSLELGALWDLGEEAEATDGAE